MTMTIGATETDDGAMIRNLERRFAVLEQCKDIHNFLDAEREYIGYLEGEKRLHPFLKSLADDEKYYDVMTRVIFVFNAPYYKEQPPEGIRIPVFLNGSRFENMNWETIKSTEIKRRTSIHEAVRDEIVGCGSAEMAHTIGNDVTHRSYLSLPRKLHFDLVERLTKDIESTARATAPKLISEGVAAQQESRSISLNENKKKLAIANSQVNLAKSPIQYDLIRIILKSNEPYREWFFDEIAEVADPEDINQTKFSNAAYQLKDAIIIKCDVRDFFEILNTKSCKINEKYRLNST